MSSSKDKLSHKKKQFYKLVVARSDILAAFQACEVFLSSVSRLGDDLYFPLLNAIVVCYSRPFSSNRPLGPLAKKWHRFDNNEFQEVHENLLDLRDRTIAHSDIRIRRVFIVPPGTQLGKSGLIAGLGVQIQNYGLPMEMFPKIKATCQDLGSRLHVDVQEQLSVLFGSERLPSERFELTFD